MSSTHGNIRTFTGRTIDPRTPWSDDIDILDIAHALSMSCRWGGHVHRFYSVAEHSVFVARTVLERHKNRHLAFSALMHDAPEAYVVDVPRPVKRLIGQAYVELESRFAAAISNKFKCNIYSLDGRIVDVDNQILHDERQQLMCSDDPDWSLGTDPIGIELLCLSPEQAKLLFLDAYNRLSPEFNLS
jgi:hypothetical protein